MSNYTTIALENHVFWTTRYLAPEHRALLKKALIHRSAKDEDLEVLPPLLRDLISECRRIQDTKFSAASASANLRWKCMGLVDAEPQPKTFTLKGQVVPYHPKRFKLVPWCTKAARFIRLDMQWAFKMLGMKLLEEKPRKEALASSDPIIAQLASPLRLLFPNAPTVKQYAHSGTLHFGDSVSTDGVQLHVPYTKRKRVRAGETEAGVRKNNQDMKSRDPRELKRALDSVTPRGLFHMDAAKDLTPDDPAFENAIGLDPGVVNLVATSQGVKVSNAAFYSQAFKVQVFDPGAALPDRHAHVSKETEGRKHSRRTRHSMIPQDIADTQAAMKGMSTKTCGQDSLSFKANLSAYLPCAEKLRVYYGSRSRRALRLTRASNARRRLRTIVNEICPDPRTVVVFGANFFGWRHTPKGTVAGPAAVKAIRRELAKTRVVVLADEYMTSRRHHVCGSELAKREGDADQREKHCLACGTDVDRDLNAALNILEVWREFIRSGARPEHLRRRVEDEEV